MFRSCDEILQIYSCALIMFSRGVYTTPNIAQGRPAISKTQWSTYGPHLAVDGNTDQDFYGGGSCFHTGMTDQWLLIDLQRQYNILKIVLYVHDSSKQGEADPRFHDVVLEVFRKNPLLCPDTDHSLCAVHPGHVNPAAIVHLQCVAHTVGRFVRIRKTTDGGQWADMLIICEVMIEGTIDSNCSANLQVVTMDNRRVDSAEPQTLISRVECTRKCYYDNRCYGINYSNYGGCQLVTEFNNSVTFDVDLDFHTSC